MTFIRQNAAAIRSIAFYESPWIFKVCEQMVSDAVLEI